jgi:SAM-dependent methyltransferase
VAESWLQPVDFPTYLEAKIAVDDESLNPRLLRRVRRRVRRLGAAQLLDVGTGTGAMLRRLLRFLPQPPDGGTALFGLDVERRSLEMAAAGLRSDLNESGFSLREAPTPEVISISTRGTGGRQGPRVELVLGGLLDPRLSDRLGGSSFDLVSAHAVLDLLPLEQALDAIRRLLRPGGLLYATLNYDGLTTLIPPYRDPELEIRLLERYERSMEERREDGLLTGGRFSGRRLCGCLPGLGYTILGAGTSDWVVFPGRRGHSPGHRLFLRALLTFMAGEALAAEGLPRAGVEGWYRERLEAVEAGTLSLVAHQLDVLAEVRA